MKNFKKRSAGNLFDSCPIKFVGCESVSKALSTKAPTLAVMSKSEIEGFCAPGKRILSTFPIRSGHIPISSVIPHLKGAKVVNVTVEGPHAVCSKKELHRMKRSLFSVTPTLGKRSMKKRILAKGARLAGAAADLACVHILPQLLSPCLCAIQRVEILTAPNRSQKLVLITDTPLPSPFTIEYVYEPQEPKDDDETKKQPNPPGNIFLKNVYNDNLILKAMEESSKHEFGKQHQGELRYPVGNKTDKKKAYSDFHLLVCLFFYIHINCLNLSSDFYFGLRQKFLSYCTDNLVQMGFYFSSASYFSRTIKNLELHNGGFEKYIQASQKPSIDFEKGEMDFLFWYTIYRHVLPCFQRVIPLCASENNQ